MVVQVRPKGSKASSLGPIYTTICCPPLPPHFPTTASPAHLPQQSGTGAVGCDVLLEGVRVGLELGQLLAKLETDWPVSESVSE